MTPLRLRIALVATLVSASGTGAVVAQDTLLLEGLSQPVEIIRDRWGVSHIYARTELDLFFAQGFNAARDRLFQLEVWRRQATGTVSEWLGERELERDIGTRLFRFRGDLAKELNHYHPHGEAIIGAFVRGINAYVRETQRDPSLLPLEFELLDITPGLWTPEVVVSRHQGLLGNIGRELALGQAVALLGPDKVKELSYFHPGEPKVALDSALDGSLLSDEILTRYRAFRTPIRFRPDDIVPEYRASVGGVRGSVDRLEEGWLDDPTGDPESLGSNNWVVAGARTQSGYPMMANDPHRALAAPSLRYWVHLVGPGWNVIGGGEPEIPGVSIGHNAHGAWGLTVFGTDGEDLYVYDTNPQNLLEYRYRGRWEPMTVIHEEIPIEGSDTVRVALKYSRHGPIVYEDSLRHKAYAVRAAWMEIGGAPYLASLRMDQAQNWEQFRDACTYSNIPGENMVWADVEGNIGWQAVGIAPIRPNWSGLVPVPGDGRYEWEGYLPGRSKPHTFNPPQAFFATANNNLIRGDFPFRNAVGWEWSDPYRWARVSEVLGSGRILGMMDMMALQTDLLSIPARTLTPLLEGVSARGRTETARRLLLDWDHVLGPTSVPAAIYVGWERRIRRNMRELAVPSLAHSAVPFLSMKKIVDWLIAPSGMFGEDPIVARDEFLVRSLDEAVDVLTGKLGPDVRRWQYGQERYKHTLIRHPLSSAVNLETRALLDVGPLPRGGNGFTVNNTAFGDNQTAGASFRLIVDTGDWDTAVGTTAPGQGGDPHDPHYRDLFEPWANNRYFPVLFSRERVESVAETTTVLVGTQR